MDDVTVTMGARGFVDDVAAREHHLGLDEPADEGGTDTAPTPMEALLGALGACTAMTLRMYADRKGWALAGVRVRLRHRQLSRAECLDCPADAEFPVVDRIEREVAVEGDLDDDQLDRLLDIANRCPVHRVLTRHPAVVTRLVRA